MARTWSQIAKVHRSLKKGARGEDVKDVQSATRRRLSARGYPDGYLPALDGEAGPETLDRIGHALYALGAAESTISAARKGTVSLGAQRMIRFPGNRTDEQLSRAKARKKEVRERAKEKRDVYEGDRAPGSGTGTVAAQRERAAEAGRFALAHAGRRYTQGPGRWVIDQGFDPAKGVMFSSGDCSGFATAVLLYALGGGPDIVNGQAWKAGYTGTMLNHGKPLGVNDVWAPGDCAFYGIPGTSGKHVVVCYKGGTKATARFASHGSAGGPYDVGLLYRSDFMGGRRFIGT